MARIAGVELPNKRLEIALTYVYGIGKSSARKILRRLDIKVNKKVSELSEKEVTQMRELVEREYVVEGDLKARIRSSIQRLIQINCYRGIRHRRGLPVRGQRTRTNAHSRKGRGKIIANKKILKG
ncbi:30S ribosomal protein S13 [Spirochaetota bacterium]|nr:30S ribosomal protein S13 [Spirochaetota bacterium]